MKKLLILFAFVAFASAKCFAYGCSVESPEWPYGYQNTIYYYDADNYIMYSIYVDHGAGYIGHNGGLNDQLMNEDGVSQKYGDYDGSWTCVVLTACNLDKPEGYAKVIAWWN